jgi:hypothetical protein
MAFDFYRDDDNLVKNIESKKIIYGLFFPILDKFFSNPIWTKIKLEIVLFQDRGYNWNYIKEKVDRCILRKNGRYYEETVTIHKFSFDAGSNHYEIKYEIDKNHPSGIIFFPTKLASFVYLNPVTCKQFIQGYILPWISENYPGTQFIMVDDVTRSIDSFDIL